MKIYVQYIHYIKNHSGLPQFNQNSIITFDVKGPSKELILVVQLLFKFPSSGNLAHVGLNCKLRGRDETRRMEPRPKWNRALRELKETWAVAPVRAPSKTG